MRNLEQSITEWRQTMLTTPGINRDTVDELENHLRETVDQLIASGLSEKEAFQKAVTKLGSSPELSSEFQKLDTSMWWPVKLIASVNALVALALGIYLYTRFGNQTSILLLGHMFTLTMGVTTMFCLGCLGICYVCQQKFSFSSSARQHSIMRDSFTTSVVAAMAAILSLVLGMMWTKGEWRSKETVELCLIVWLAGIMAMHHFRRISPSDIMIASICGNIVLLVGLHGVLQQMLGQSLYTVAAIALHLGFILAAFSPLGRFKLHKAT